MVADDYLLSILAVFKDSASPSLKKFGTAVLGAGKATDKAGKQADNFGNKLAALSAKFVSIRTGAQQMQELFQRGFEFAELGAQSIQTTTAFDGLLDTLGAAPDTLDQLRSASRNTISDLDMMASTSTLLAGAQGELATALAGSTPKLMEIAKAANALNPSLGDTNFLYQSLATGIKRASPMILDNLGLMIKIGDANEKYAASLGKSVESLTAEEKQIALLNETMRAGQVLIGQAGDNIDSATDAFAQFETAASNAKTALAEMAVPMLTPLLDQFTGLLSITAEETVAIEKMKQVAGIQAQSAEEYAERIRQKMIEQAVAAGESREHNERAFQVTKDNNIAILSMTGQLIAKDREYIAIKIANNKKHGRSTEELEKQYDELTDKLERNASSTLDLDWATTELGKAQQDQHDELEALIQSYYEYGDQVDINTEGAWRAAEALRNQSEESAELQGHLRGIARAAKEVVDEEYALELAGERAAYGQRLFKEELSELSLVMRGAVGDEMGDYADTQADLSLKATILKGKIDDLKASEDWPSEEALGQLKAWRDELTQVQITIDETAEAHRLAMNKIIFDMTLVQAQADGMITDAEMTLIRSLAEGLGLVDPETARVWGEISEHMAGLTDANIGETANAVLALTKELRGADAAGAAMPAIGLVENWGILAQEQIAATYDEATGSVEEAAGIVTGEIEELETSLLDLIEPQYEMQLDIKDREDTLEAVASLKGMVEYLSRPHTIAFRITTTGELPGGGGNGDGGSNGGGGGNGPGDPWDRYKGERQTGGPVFETGLYQLHAGELVIPARDAQQIQPATGASSITYGDTLYLGSMQSGGIVSETGLALVHAGELVIPPMEAQQMQSAGGVPSVTYGDTNEFNLNVTSVQEMTSLIQEFEMMRALAG